MASKNIHPQLRILLVVAVYSLGAVRIRGFVPKSSSSLVATGRSRDGWCERTPLFYPELCLEAASGGYYETDDGDDDDDENETKMVSDFFFNMDKANIDSRSSMDAGIHEMTGGGGSGTEIDPFENAAREPSIDGPSPQSTIVVMDWECLLDSLPYHIEIGIHAARTTWPHLNDLCNFDTDREWLENKLAAMSHVLGSPEGPDRSRHLSCEFALATRLILEEQALDRNESTGKNGNYARKFHPRSEINGNNEFGEESRSRRPLTAGELAVNWREFIRSTLIARYARGPDGKCAKKEPMEALEETIEDYLTKTITRKSNNQSSDPKRLIAVNSLSLFSQTKFALRNSATKLVVRISHKFDNDIVARSLNKQLQLLPHERIAKTYKSENAIRRLFLNEDKNIVLLLQPDYKYEFFHHDNDSSSESILGSSENGSGNSDKKKSDLNAKTSEEKCLNEIMKFTHQCDRSRAKRQGQQNKQQQPEHQEPPAASVVWVDSSWHRLQGLAPVFGDVIPGGKNGTRNTARCSLAASDEDDDDDDDRSVWLSLWLAKWPTENSGGSSREPKKKISSSENHEAAMVYPWTDSLVWENAEGILVPATWGSSEIAFQ